MFTKSLAGLDIEQYDAAGLRKMLREHFIGDGWQTPRLLDEITTTGLLLRPTCPNTESGQRGRLGGRASRFQPSRTVPGSRPPAIMALHTETRVRIRWSAPHPWTGPGARRC